MNWDELSDAELVKQFKSGNSSAFDAIVRRFQDRVYRLASICSFYVALPGYQERMQRVQ